MNFEARKNPRKCHADQCSHILEDLSAAWTFGIRMVEVSVISFGIITKEILALFHIREVEYLPSLSGSAAVWWLSWH